MKPRRNAPCPCGSGEKYKRCACGAYEATQFPRRKELEAEHAAYLARMAALPEAERRRRRAEAMAVLSIAAGLVRR